jgi:hypothetical protein
MADEHYLTPAQVADELHVTVVAVRRWIANGGAASVQGGASKMDDSPLRSRRVPVRRRLKPRAG